MTTISIRTIIVLRDPDDADDADDRHADDPTAIGRRSGDHRPTMLRMLRMLRGKNKPRSGLRGLCGLSLCLVAKAYGSISLGVQ